MTAGLDPSRTVLPNGVTLVAKHTRKTPAVTINLAIRAGAISPASTTTSRRSRSPTA